MLTRSGRCEFEVERLESRRLLAGVVKFDVTNAGDIVVTGDNASNDIRILAESIAGEPVLRVEGHGDTLISFNGQLNSQYTIPWGQPDDSFNIEGDLRIRMRGGDDDVEIIAWSSDGPMVIQEDLDVNLGSGSDSLVISGRPVPNFVEVSSTVLGKIKVVGGSGGSADYVEIENMGTPEMDVNVGSAGNQGLDQVFVRNSVAGTLRLVGTGGETEIGVYASAASNATLNSGTGSDQIIVSYSLLLEDLNINSGSAPNGAAVGDFIQVGSAIVHGDTSIVGGGGRTQVYFDGTQPGFNSSFGGDVKVTTGGGDDVVRVTNNEITWFGATFEVRTGGGDDVVEIQGRSVFLGAGVINLGGGSDLLDFDFDPVADEIDGLSAPPRFHEGLIVRGGGGVDSIYTLADVSSASEPDITSIEIYAA